MKRIIATVLLTAIIAVSFVGCSADPNDKGPIIPIYLTSLQTNLDPTLMFYDHNTIKYTGLLFEGLTVIDEDGDIEGGIAKDWYTEFDDERGEYYIYFELHETEWSDGRKLLADHFVYAWKRILTPGTFSPAACLLYDIKNAKSVKAGNGTVDDLGIAAVDNYLLEIQLEKKIDIELFLEAVSSPSLVPMRDDVLAEYADNWATSIENMVSNGPFAIRTMDKKGIYNVEFSKYYRLTGEEGEDPKKFVYPYRLITDYSMTIEQQAKAFDDGEIFYLGEFTKELYNKYSDDIESQPLLSVYTVLFNTKNKNFATANQRKAFSLALDREAIANSFGCGTKPATGLVTPGVSDVEMDEDFREAGGALLSTKAQLTEAKALVANASKTAFKLTVRNTPEQKAAAQIAVENWKALGYTVTLRVLDDEKFARALYSGDFEAIAFDYQGLSTNAYSFLAPFAKEYSGSKVSVADDSIGYTPFISNFADDSYDAAIDKVYAATTREDRAAALHKAEELFIELAPAAPVCFYYDSYVKSSDMKDIETTKYGFKNFKDTTLKNYLERNEQYLGKAD